MYRMKCPVEFDPQPDGYVDEFRHRIITPSSVMLRVVAYVRTHVSSLITTITLLNPYLSDG